MLSVSPHALAHHPPPVEVPLEQAPPPPAVVVIVVVHGDHLRVDVLIVVVVIVAVITVVVIVVVGVDDLRDEVRGEEDGGDHAEHAGRRLGGARRAREVIAPALVHKVTAY